MEFKIKNKELQGFLTNCHPYDNRKREKSFGRGPIKKFVITRGNQLSKLRFLLETRNFA